MDSREQEEQEAFQRICAQFARGLISRQKALNDLDRLDHGDSWREVFYDIEVELLEEPS